MHSAFYNELETRVSHWSDRHLIGDLFLSLVSSSFSGIVWEFIHKRKYDVAVFLMEFLELYLFYKFMQFPAELFYFTIGEKSVYLSLVLSHLNQTYLQLKEIVI